VPRAGTARPCSSRCGVGCAKDRVTAAIISLLVLLGVCGRAPAGIVLPDETGNAAGDVRSYEIEVTGGHYDEAADRYWALATTRGADLISRPDGSLNCVRDVIDAVPADALEKVAAAIRRRHGADAAGMIAGVTADPQYLPQQLYTAMLKCRHTAAGDAAAATGATRAASQGDLATADLLSGKPLPSSAVPVTFESPNFGQAAGYKTPKVIPVLAGDSVFVADTQQVVALSTSGQLKWSAKTGDQNSSTERISDLTTCRGAVSIPAIVTDSAGTAQIVVTRSCGAGSAGRLMALRASDGRVLWSTTSTMPGTAVLSSPTVAGRYAYCIGTDFNPEDNTADLQLIAVDVTDGRPLWRAHLATITNVPRTDRGFVVGWFGFFLDQGPPAVSGDSVVVAPGVGAIFAIDRIDGTVRWIRPYVPAVLDENALRAFRIQRGNGSPAPAPLLSWTQIYRWNNTPVIAEGIVTAAPQDTDQSFGIELSTGQLLWQSPALSAEVPIAAVGGRVIWAGEKRVVAIDPKSGQGSWSFSPPNRQTFTGPPVVRHGRIVLPTVHGPVAVDSARGQEATVPGGVDFGDVISTHAGRSALDNADLTRWFVHR
jgi:outer membrane protein assembly factor BamB